ncbi:hypothetical protein CEP49_00145 [Mergibacter septicus]|uniref:hypothetical protein n=1 Tax=Mergibacter septicus TaxID=221402 RepID=UPI001178EC9F|nr:hypothetical protein [Mergibacter septicus]AWX13072.1 hypothetical protein CEP49_00145 [Mergibacter septicus]
MKFNKPYPNQINLLPWRQHLYRSQIRLFLCQVLCILTITLPLTGWLLQSNQYRKNQLEQLQQKKQQLIATQQNLEKMIQQQRQQLAGKLELNALSLTTLNKFFPFLTLLPLTKGNLQQVQLSINPLNKKQFPLFQLEGIAGNQLELEQLQQQIPTFWYSEKQSQHKPKLISFTSLTDKRYHFVLEFNIAFEPSP